MNRRGELHAKPKRDILQILALLAELDLERLVLLLLLLLLL